ncbi:MAG: M67 family metallopeptidase [Nitrososphaerales archaeon]|jgi:proteasome lid subunit RPN8/RPN11
MTTRVAKRVFDEMRAHAESTYPDECCGLLVADGDGIVIDSVRVANAYAGPKHDRYDIRPLDLFRADRAVSQRGLSIAGVYHSHPDYPATLSAFDLEHSFPWYSYVVVSVPGGKAGDTRSWAPGEDRRSASEQTLEVIDG